MKNKWLLIAKLPERGFLDLLKDLDYLYENHRGWGCDNAHITFRLNDGKYDVNVLLADWDEMRERISEDAFVKRYREVSE